MSDYIAKPVDIDLLLALLRVWIGRARERPGAASVEAARGAVGVQCAVVDAGAQREDEAVLDARVPLDPARRG